jgi:hypothetical protein
VRAAEAETRSAAPVTAPEPEAATDDLAGALYLAELALREAALPVPVPPAAAAALVAVLRSEGLEGEEVLRVLPHLPVSADAAEQVRAELADETR